MGKVTITFDLPDKNENPSSHDFLVSELRLMRDSDMFHIGSSPYDAQWIHDVEIVIEE
jgi:hypothetical protein